MKTNPGKRIITFLLLFVLLAGGPAGCSKNDTVKLDPKNPVTITVWHYYHGAQKSALDNAVKEFNETLGYEKGIIVEAESRGGVDELAANVLAAANREIDAGAMPDIFGTHGDTALLVSNMGMLAAIDDYLTSKEISEYEDSFIQEGKIGTEHLIVFPIAKSTESLMLNKTDFDAFTEGLRAEGWEETVSYDDLATWEGLLRVADLYYRYTERQSPEKGGKAFMGVDSIANYVIVGSRQLGQDLITVKDGIVTVNLDNAIMAKLWDTYYDATVTGRFVKLGRFCSDDIKTGDSLCFIGSTTSASYFPAELTLENGEQKSIEMVVFPMPVFENGAKIAISQGAGMAVTKSTEEKEYASVLFLQWFTEAERNIAFSLGSGYLPVKKEALDDNLLNPAFEAIESSDVSTQNIIKSLKVGIDQLRSYTLYSSEVFEGGSAFRENIPVVLAQAAQEGRNEYMQSLRNGLSLEQAFAGISEKGSGAFMEWLNSLQK